MPNDYIVPGLEIPPEDQPPTDTDRARWHALCPACADVHGITVSRWWDDERDDGSAGMVEVHCLFCAKTGKHFRLQPTYPFKVILEHQLEKVEHSSRYLDGTPIEYE